MVRIKFKGIGKTKTLEFDVIGGDIVARWASIAGEVYKALMTLRQHDRTIQIVGVD